MPIGVLPDAAGTGGGGDLLAYGSWSYVAGNIAISTNATTTVVSYDTADVTPLNMQLVGGTRITALLAGMYEFGCSPQVHIATAVGSDVTFWPRTGAGNVPNSASTVQLGNNTRFALPFVTYFIRLAVGEYVEFCFHGVGDSPELYRGLAQVGPPSIPLEPAIIVTAKRIGS